MKITIFEFRTMPLDDIFARKVEDNVASTITSYLISFHFHSTDINQIYIELMTQLKVVNMFCQSTLKIYVEVKVAVYTICISANARPSSFNFHQKLATLDHASLTRIIV